MGARVTRGLGERGGEGDGGDGTQGDAPYTTIKQEGTNVSACLQFLFNGFFSSHTSLVFSFRFFFLGV